MFGVDNGLSAPADRPVCAKMSTLPYFWGM
jgi:hypothetical protein